MALGPKSAYDRQSGYMQSIADIETIQQQIASGALGPGLLTREKFAAGRAGTASFLTTPHVIRSTSTYDIAAADSITLATGPLFLTGTTFNFTENRAWNGEPGIIVPSGCYIDVLNIICTTACTTLKNMVRVMGDARIGEIRIVAPMQVNNIGDYDVSAINVVGPNVHIGRVYSERFDKVISFGGQITSVANSGGGAHNCYLGELIAFGYQKALQVKGSSRFTAGSIIAQVRSSFSEVGPGRNVVHIDDCDVVNIGQVNGSNSTEHGIYVSGGNGDNAAGIAMSSRINFGEINLTDCGQTGVKLKADQNAGAAGADFPHMSITIGSLSVRGAGATTDLADPSDPGSGNSDGLRVENVEHLNVGSLFVAPNGAYGTVSCGYGLHLDGVRLGVVSQAMIMGSQRASLYVRDYRGNNGRVSVPDLMVMDSKSHAVHFSHTTGTVRQYHIKGRADTVAGNLIKIEGPGSEAPSGSQSYIEMDYTKVTGAVLDRTGDADIKVKTTNLDTAFT